ncbi:beta-ribofuranosylaminobenzene 5'-phosphate synthase [Novipirellula artificiosorum]|uniref:GHMP kinase C-terminal domain-containing protein n=1 Tax=Novipirellula artificiosorum TaxID=2528016 RepID=A0A5C6DLI6_9BACT|nr:beta-ribofuranosylaminobenzene 5'-phosphate synthase [Novipirellula artificiosorum]TWU37045.1 hypothetical protein Poly41_31710 [Novipirellula artificiosorum]
MTNQQVRVITGARLHFGLLDTQPPYGGVGVMIDSPATEVVVRRSQRYRPCAKETERIDAIVRRFAAFANLKGLPPCEMQVLQRPDPHTGRGSGTQLSMAVAEALCLLFQVRCNREDLAFHVAARGKRSAVGIHGYFAGGLIFEESMETADLNPIRERVSVPHAWCVAMFRSRRTVPTVSGDLEQNQFNQLPPATSELRDELRCLASEQLTTAIQREDFASFTDAVHRYNRASGMLFESVQNGPYNGPAVTRLVDSLIDRGAKGVGQSSWGPTVFAWFETRQEAEYFVRTRSNAEHEEVQFAAPKNEPRTVHEGQR